MEEDTQPAAQPTFPQSSISITPQGLLIGVILAPGLQLTTMIGEEQMNEICRMWVKTRQDIADQLRTVERTRPRLVKGS